MSGRFERWYPAAGGGLGTLIVLVASPDCSTFAGFRDILTLVVSIAAIGIGFLGTAMSILYSIDEKWIVRQMRKAGYYKTLLSYLLGAIRTCFLLAVVTGCGLFVDLQRDGVFQGIVFAMWAGLVVAAILSSYRVISIFVGILQSEE